MCRFFEIYGAVSIVLAFITGLAVGLTVQLDTVDTWTTKVIELPSITVYGDDYNTEKDD